MKPMHGNCFLSVQMDVTAHHRQQVIEWIYDVSCHSFKFASFFFTKIDDFQFEIYLLLSENFQF